jgi:hypothetical protein
MEGYTASEMAALLGLPLKTVQMRLLRSGIKPLTHESVYPISALAAIQDVTVGRPRKKPETPEPDSGK